MSENDKAQVTRTDDLIVGELHDELWREYDFGDANNRTVYRIDYPLEFRCRPGGETHRVIDNEGVVHCVPAPGRCGCVLRWKSKIDADPCQY